MANLCFIKHNKIGFLKRVFFSNLKTWFTNYKLVCHKKWMFSNNSCLLVLKHYFFCRNLVCEKWPFLCPFFCVGGGGGSLIGQKWCTLQLKQNKKTQTFETTICLQALGFCCKATKQLLLMGGENKKLIGHSGVFWMVLFEK